MADLVTFLKARLDDDEQWAHYSGDPIGQTLDSRARVLADVAAKRWLLGKHRSYEGWCSGCESNEKCDNDPDDCYCPPWYPFPCDTVKHLAAVYDTHPDYDEEWRP